MWAMGMEHRPTGWWCAQRRAGQPTRHDDATVAARHTHEALSITVCQNPSARTPAFALVHAHSLVVGVCTCGRVHCVCVCGRGLCDGSKPDGVRRCLHTHTRSQGEVWCIIATKCLGIDSHTSLRGKSVFIAVGGGGGGGRATPVQRC